MTPILFSLSQVQVYNILKRIIILVYQSQKFLLITYLVYKMCLEGGLEYENKIFQPSLVLITQKQYIDLH